MKQNKDWIDRFNDGAERGAIILGFIGYAYIMLRVARWMLTGD